MLFNYGEKLMAKILEFKLPEKSYPSKSNSNLVVSSSVDDLMLIIHHALHGTDEKYQPKDRQLAAMLLDELANSIKNGNDENEEDCLILSRATSQAVMDRYPQMYQRQTDQTQTDKEDGQVL